MRLLWLGVVVLTVANPGFAEEPKRTDPAAATSDGRYALRVVFSPQDIQIIRDHYAPRYRRLPPGLQKKFQRTGQLPPGWQKKLEPIPPALDHRLAGLPAGYQRGVIDGHAVIYRPGGILVDAAILF